MPNNKIDSYQRTFNQSISRRRVLQLGLSLLAAVNVYKRKSLSEDAEIVLTCLSEFHSLGGAKFNDLVKVVQYVSNMTIQEIEDTVVELTRLNLIYQRLKENQQILYLR